RSLEARFLKRTRHSRMKDGSVISMICGCVCFVCHKSESEILDVKYGEICNPENALRSRDEQA
ncbi:MAG: hypothetical protein ACREDF_08780, partial [Thermoplasmata archaeon]